MILAPSSSSFFKICTPPLHAVGLLTLCKSPALPSALLIIWLTILWCSSSNQRRTSTSVSFSFAVFHLVLIQNLFLDLPLPSPSFHHTAASADVHTFLLFFSSLCFLFPEHVSFLRSIFHSDAPLPGYFFFAVVRRDLSRLYGPLLGEEKSPPQLSPFAF